MRSMDTTTRNDIVNEVAKAIGMPQKEVKAVLEAILETIADELEKGKMIELRRFGTFYLRETKERIAQNISKKERVIVPAKKKIAFRASRMLKEKVEKVIK